VALLPVGPTPYPIRKSSTLNIRNISQAGLRARARLFTSLLAAAAAGWLLAPLLHAATVANFSAGNDNTNGGTNAPTPDSFTGSAGGGWQGGWITTASGTAVATVKNTSPVSGGGNYLSMTLAGSSSVAQVGLDRLFGGAGGGVSLTATQTISWDFRLDETGLSTFTGGNDRYQFMGNAAPDQTTAGSDEWFVFASGANPNLVPGFVADTWLFYSGSTSTNAFNNGTVANSGIALTPGTTYHFTITTNPVTKTYLGSVSDGVTTYTTPTALNWRNYSSNPTASGGYFIASTIADNAGETRAYSLDSVQIVPEPSTMPLLMGALGLLGLRRRPPRALPI